MWKLALSFAIILACTAFAFAGPEAIHSSSKEMKAMVAPAPTCDFSWTGFYIGGRAGYGWSGDTDFRIEGRPNDALFPFHVNPGHQGLDPDGFIGGGQIGFNWQFGKWFVVGAEADFSGSTMDDDSTRLHFVPEDGADVAVHASQDINWFGTVRGRIGVVPCCKLLVYGTGGFAYADVDESASLAFPSGGAFYSASRSSTDTGWTAGGGLEYAISRHWTVKVEYLFVDVGDHSATGFSHPAVPPFTTRDTWDTQFHTVTGGINFKF